MFLISYLVVYIGHADSAVRIRIMFWIRQHAPNIILKIIVKSLRDKFDLSLTLFGESS